MSDLYSIGRVGTDGMTWMTCRLSGIILYLLMAGKMPFDNSIYKEAGEMTRHDIGRTRSIDINCTRSLFYQMRIYCDMNAALIHFFWLKTLKTTITLAMWKPSPPHRLRRCRSSSSLPKAAAGPRTLAWDGG